MSAASWLHQSGGARNHFSVRNIKAVRDAIEVCVQSDFGDEQGSLDGPGAHAGKLRGRRVAHNRTGGSLV